MIIILIIITMITIIIIIIIVILLLLLIIIIIIINLFSANTITYLEALYIQKLLLLFNEMFSVALLKWRGCNEFHRIGAYERRRDPQV